MLFGEALNAHRATTDHQLFMDDLKALQEHIVMVSMLLSVAFLVLTFV